MQIPISIRTSLAKANIRGLVDLGATDCFMSPTIIKRMGLGKRPLEKPQKIWNIDNTENKDGSITHYVDLQVQMRRIHRNMRFLITNIGNEDIVLGYRVPLVGPIQTKVQLEVCHHRQGNTTDNSKVCKSPNTPQIDHHAH